MAGDVEKGKDSKGVLSRLCREDWGGLAGPSLSGASWGCTAPPGLWGRRVGRPHVSASGFTGLGT